MAVVDVSFNAQFFNEIMRSPAVQNMTRATAEKVLSAAQSTAPVDTGAYKAGLTITVKKAKYRDVILVVGTDWKTMLVESKTGNLARALKLAKKNG